MVLFCADTEAFLVVKECELASIRLTFTLRRDSPSRWKSWQDFVKQLCGSWGLGLYDPSSGSIVDASEILRVLAETTAWQDFEANFGWPGLASEEESGKGPGAVVGIR
jgi:hypothetical protein